MLMSVVYSNVVVRLGGLRLMKPTYAFKTLVHYLMYIQLNVNRNGLHPNIEIVHLDVISVLRRVCNTLACRVTQTLMQI